ATRRLGVTERWGNNETQGPYLLTLPIDANVSDCRDITLHVRKTPVGSADGKGWIVKMTAALLRADGSTDLGAIAARDLWRDGHAFDRRFGLCQPAPAIPLPDWAPGFTIRAPR